MGGGGTQVEARVIDGLPADVDAALILTFLATNMVFGAQMGTRMTQGKNTGFSGSLFFFAEFTHFVAEVSVAPTVMVVLG
jgi:hypothetical protein